MDEQQATDKLEELVGSIDGCFRLSRLWTSCVAAASGNQFTLRKLPSAEERFRKRAKEDGYSQAAIDHYLNYVR